MTRYVQAWSWTGTIHRFLSSIVVEKPLLNVCSGREPFGDITMDLYEPASVKGDWKALPFADDSFAAVFADPPWNSGYKKQTAIFIREAFRIAPIIYLMAPWLYGGKIAQLSNIWVRHFPGVNTPVLITRYQRKSGKSEVSE